MTARSFDDSTLVPIAPEQVIAGFIAERYDQPSRVSEIAAAIAFEIISGIHEPGAEINSVAVARRFETSRTPVREAFLLLEKEALVELPPRKRPIVPRLSMAEVEDNYRLRVELLGYMAGEITRKATDDDLASLQRQARALESASQRPDALDAYFWSNVRYYDVALTIARNRALKRSLDTLLLSSMRLRRIGLSLPGRLQNSLRDHLSITEALVSRDPILAGAIMRSNLLGALEALRTQGAPALGCR